MFTFENQTVRLRNKEEQSITVTSSHDVKEEYNLGTAHVEGRKYVVVYNNINDKWYEHRI